MTKLLSIRRVGGGGGGGAYPIPVPGVLFFYNDFSVKNRGTVCPVTLTFLFLSFLFGFVYHLLIHLRNLTVERLLFL